MTVDQKEGRREQPLRAGTEVGILLLALLSVVIYVLYALWKTDPGFPWDDSWIHMALARNLAETGRIGLHAGQWSGGGSSLLWVFLLAAGYRLGLSPWTMAILFGGTAHLVATWFFSRLAQDLLGRAGGSLAGVLYALCGPLVFLSLSGMETGLLLALGIAAIWSWTRSRPAWTAALLGLLVLLRIEAIALWGLVLVAEVVARRRERAAAPLALLVALPMAALVLNGAINWISGGQLLPITMTGRQWVWGLSSPGSWVAQEKVSFLSGWRAYLLDWMLQAFRFEIWPALYWSFLGLALAWLAGGAAFVAWRTWKERRDRRSWGVALLLLWGTGLLLTYFLLLPVPSTRHQVVALPGLLLLLVCGGEAIVALLNRNAASRSAWIRGLGRALMVLLLLGAGAVLWQQWLVNYEEQVNHINQAHVQMARWIAQNVPAGASVAAFDIGAISYLGQHNVIDLGGLTDSSLTPYLYENNIIPYLRDRDVTYLAMPDYPDSHLWTALGIDPVSAQGAFTTTLLQEYQVAPYVYPPFDRPADYYFYPAARYIAIYTIHWIPQSSGLSRAVDQPPSEVRACSGVRFPTTCVEPAP